MPDLELTEAQKTTLTLREAKILIGGMAIHQILFMVFFLMADIGKGGWYFFCFPAAIIFVNGFVFIARHYGYMMDPNDAPDKVKKKIIEQDNKAILELK